MSDDKIAKPMVQENKDLKDFDLDYELMNIKHLVSLLSYSMLCLLDHREVSDKLEGSYALCNLILKELGRVEKAASLFVRNLKSGCL
jgi:hypothetical protein